MDLRQPGGFERPLAARLFKWIAALAVLLLLVSLLNPLRVVSSGTRGVIATFGKVDQTPLDEGLHVVWPLVQRLTLIDVRVQKSEGSGSAASSDLQTVKATAALNWHIDPRRVSEVFQNVGPPEAVASRIIEPAAQESVKAVTARFTAEQLITKRLEVTQQIREALEKRIAPFGVVIDGLAAVNYDFSQAFDQAIEAKVTAEQKKLTAERDLERIRIEGEQKLTMARAEAESLRAQRTEITAELLRLREIENHKAAIAKWDGKLPTYSGMMAPFITLPGK
jgi:regulator of protease activity HflC (stomatin/prohibitin superfamily)